MDPLKKNIFTMDPLKKTYLQWTLYVYVIVKPVGTNYLKLVLV